MLLAFVFALLPVDSVLLLEFVPAAVAPGGGAGCAAASTAWITRAAAVRMMVRIRMTHL